MTTSPAPAGVALAAPVGRWTADPGSSTAAFAVRNFGVNTVRGTAPIREAVAVVAEGGRISTVRAVVQLAGIDTANSRRDLDLRGRRLLNTEQFPELVFEAADARASADSWRLAGTVTARGVSIPVVLDATLTTGPTDGLVTIRATTRFDRRDLGIRAPRLLIGREVQVQITAQFHRAG